MIDDSGRADAGSNNRELVFQPDRAGGVQKARRLRRVAVQQTVLVPPATSAVPGPKMMPRFDSQD